MVKRSVSDTFEIVVVLAIVAIVALTGQTLIRMSANVAAAPAGDGSANAISGFAVADEGTSGRTFTDISVEGIDVNPPSPLIGDPFRVTVFLKNRGTEEIRSPFYVDLAFEPRGDGVEAYQQQTVTEVMPQILAPGQETSLSFLVTTIVPEGPVRIIATADSTNKLDDMNTANNQLSKTIIVAVE